MTTLYIDGKLASRYKEQVDFFSQEVRDKFDERALNALVDLITSESIQRNDGVQSIDSKDVLENLKVHWDGLTEDEKFAMSDGSICVWPIKDVLDKPDACIAFPWNWGATHLMPGDVIMRLEGQLGLRQGLESIAGNENWYFSDDGESLQCDVDLVLSFPWLNKRVRIPNLCCYQIVASDDAKRKNLFGYGPAHDLCLKAKKILAELDEDELFDEDDFIPGFQVVYHEHLRREEMGKIITDELGCDEDMALTTIDAFMEEFDEVEKETMYLLSDPHITRNVWVTDRS